MMNVRNIDLKSFAVISLCVLWAALTFSIALTEIAFVCALVFWIAWHVQLKTGGDRTTPLKIDGVFWGPLALFFICVLISYFTSEFPKESLKGLLKIAKPLLAFLMAAELFRDAGSRRRFAGVFLATFILVVIDCSIQYAFGKDLLRGFSAEYSRSGVRLVGPFGNFAKMATYLVLVVPVLAMQFWSDLSGPSKTRHCLYALGLTLAGLVLLYLTHCRGAIIALGLTALILFIYKRWFKVLGVMLLLCLTLIAFIPRNVLIHPDTLGKEQSFFERIELWKRALDVIAAKPWTGTGINTYNVAHAKYDARKQKKLMPISGTSIVIRQNQDGSVSFDTGSAVWTSDTMQKTIRVGGIDYHIYKDPENRYFIWNDLVARGYYVHNGYLQLAAEIGLPGIFFFLLFLFMFFKRSFQTLRKVRGSLHENEQLGMLAGLLAFLIYATADNNLQSPPSLMFFWFSAGVLMAMQQRDPEVKTA